MSYTYNLLKPVEVEKHKKKKEYNKEIIALDGNENKQITFHSKCK